VTDVQTNDKQAEIRQAKEAIAGPVPLIKDAPASTLVLPRGMFQQGAWQREVTVRELTGIDEETLSKATDQLTFFSNVIALGTVSIGMVDVASIPLAERKFFLGDLLVGEREQIFMKVIQATFGNEKTVPFTCTLCSVEQEMTLLIDQDFPPKEVPDIEQLTFTYTLRNGDVIDVRPAVGADQEETLTRKGMSLAEQNTVLLSRCITKRNGDLIVDPLTFSRKLGIKDRYAVLEEMINRQPSVQLDVTTACSACGGEQKIGLGWADLFRA
jgi:hypothetical protein